MIRNRFNELCEHLKAQALSLQFRPEQFDTELEDFTVESGGHNETENGFWFANFRYRGVIYLERLNKAALPLLALLVKAWLDENDDVRERFRLADPQFQAADLDSKSMDVVVTVDFLDPVYLAEKADGQVKWCGRTFAVAEYPLCVAEAGKVNDGRV